MPDGTLPLLIALIVLIIFSAFFSATETAYTSLNVIKAKSLAQKNPKYKKVLRFYINIKDFLKIQKFLK